MFSPLPIGEDLSIEQPQPVAQDRRQVHIATAQIARSTQAYEGWLRGHSAEPSLLTCLDSLDEVQGRGCLCPGDSRREEGQEDQQIYC